MNNPGKSHEFLSGLRRGLGFFAGLALGSLVLLTTLVAANQFTEFAPGDLVSSDQINQNFALIRDELIAPVGSIVAWHRDLGGAPAIPAGWVECDGGTVTDTESPLYGQTVPDLNGQALFLRGGATSGTQQADAMQAHGHSNSPHSHHIDYSNLSYAGGGIGSPGQLSPGAGAYGTSSSSISIGNPSDSGTGAGNPRIDTETRPANLSVIWIIRIR